MIEGMKRYGSLCVWTVEQVRTIYVQSMSFRMEFGVVYDTHCSELILYKIPLKN